MLYVYIHSIRCSLRVHSLRIASERERLAAERSTPSGPAGCARAPVNPTPSQVLRFCAKLGECRSVNVGHILQKFFLSGAQFWTRNLIADAPPPNLWLLCPVDSFLHSWGKRAVSRSAGLWRGGGVLARGSPFCVFFCLCLSLSGFFFWISVFLFSLFVCFFFLSLCLSFLSLSFCLSCISLSLYISFLSLSLSVFFSLSLVAFLFSHCLSVFLFFLSLSFFSLCLTAFLFSLGLSIFPLFLCLFIFTLSPPLLISVFPFPFPFPSLYLSILISISISLSFFFLFLPYSLLRKGSPFQKFMRIKPFVTCSIFVLSCNYVFILF